MTFGVVTTYLALISLAKLSPNMSTKYWKVLAGEVLLESKSEVKLSKNAYDHVWERGADMRRKIKEAKRRKQIQNTNSEDQVEPMFVTAHQKRMNRLSSGIQNGRASESSRGARALNSLADSDPAAAAQGVMDVIGLGIEERLTKLFTAAKTPECRAEIGEHFGYFLNAIGKEQALPFRKYDLKNECTEEKPDFDDLPEGVTIGDIQNRVYQPDLNDEDIHDNHQNDVYIDHYTNLNLLYVILTHNDAPATIRLIEALQDEGHSFVVHVDGKESSADVYRQLVDYFGKSSSVHIAPDRYRCRVNWGGFSMVNATLQSLKYAFSFADLNFHKVVHIAATSYPIKNNTEIRQRIASFPLDANMVNVVFKPTEPGPGSWQYFVECDDAVHRIYRLDPLNWWSNNGVDLYTSSQWFIISRDFAQYIASALPRTFVREFIDYAEHVVIADETFFGTVLRHTEPFCHKHHNSNFLHVQFDKWENELNVDVDSRDPKKCLMPSPDHCGRSPTEITIDYLPILELSNDLFARKFSDEVDLEVKNVIDEMRTKDVCQRFDPSFEGHGVLIVARETIGEVPLCLGLGPSKNKVRLTPCFYDEVVPSLASGWENGAVIIEETLLHNRWEFGPCSSDGDLERLSNGTLKMTPGVHSPTGPICGLKQMDGVRKNRCIDGESERIQPGGEVQVFPCRNKWPQYVSVGNGTIAPFGSLHTTVPRHILGRIEKSGKVQYPYLCLGVKGRGKFDEEEWSEDQDDIDDDEDIINEMENSNGRNQDGFMPLTAFENAQIVTTSCANDGAVIEWLFIPFIVEEDSSLKDSNVALDVEDDYEATY